MKKNKTNATRIDDHHHHYMRHDLYRSQNKPNCTAYDSAGYEPRPSRSIEEILQDAYRMFAKKHPDQLSNLQCSVTTYNNQDKQDE
tara:strand:- start:3381 stop:3638 length:258 start_codon:yes stop_codon:yes gene_type:complete